MLFALLIYLYSFCLSQVKVQENVYILKYIKSYWER